MRDWNPASQHELLLYLISTSCHLLKRHDGMLLRALSKCVLKPPSAQGGGLPFRYSHWTNRSTCVSKNRTDGLEHWPALPRLHQINLNAQGQHPSMLRPGVRSFRPYTAGFQSRSQCREERLPAKICVAGIFNVSSRADTDEADLVQTME